MNTAQSAALKTLLTQQDIASLGTLHDGEPFVSMVPYAILSNGKGFIIHVSRLAMHTRNMLQHPKVSLMIIAPREPASLPQELARISIQGQARQINPTEYEYAETRQAYLSKLPSSEELFNFTDFSLFIIEPESARFVGGFAQAFSLTGKTLQLVMIHKESEDNL